MVDNQFPSSHLAGMQIDLDRDSPIPLHDQIVKELRRRIDSGELAAGERLLSSRDLADLLRVNRATVVQCYQDLKERGLVESGVGRGTFVRPGSGPAADPASDAAAPGTARGSPWEGLRTDPGVPFVTASHRADPELVPLSRAIPCPDLLPVDPLRQAFDAVFARLGTDLLQYAAPAGYEPLRQLLAQRFQDRGLPMDRNQVLIVNGCQQGLDLVARMLLRGGGSVLTSRPTFAGALDVFRSWRIRVQGLPMDGQGLDPVDVARAVRRRRPRLLYTVPTCHNPTGVTQPEARRDELVRLAERHRFPILEDDWLGELVPGPRPLKARDPQGLVLFLGSISKVLVPGLRVGWLVVPTELFPVLLDLKCRSDLATNLPGQAAVHELLANGAYDRHVVTLRVALARRRRRVEQAIRDSFPEEARVLRPHDGMVLWVSLPGRVPARRILDRARAAGLDLAAGDAFDPTHSPLPGFRLSYAMAREAALAPAVHRLGGILKEELSGGAARVGPPLV